MEIDINTIDPKTFTKEQADALLSQCKLSLGDIRITPGARLAFQAAHLAGAKLAPGHYLTRHMMGDWGDISDEDKDANDHDAADFGRVISAYDLPHTGERIWIVTESDRSATTVLLPDEY